MDGDVVEEGGLVTGVKVRAEVCCRGGCPCTRRITDVESTLSQQAILCDNKLGA